MFEFGASHNKLPCGKTTDPETFLGCHRILSEMNKCFTLVHLTSTFRIHSRVSGDSRARTSGLLTNWLLRCLVAGGRLVKLLLQLQQLAQLVSIGRVGGGRTVSGACLC